MDGMFDCGVGITCGLGVSRLSPDRVVEVGCGKSGLA